MAKAVSTIGKIAGAVALVASVIPGGQGIAAIAGVVSGVANIGSQILAKPPPARGSITQINIAPDAPMPYVMGEGYFGGVLRHDRGYGPTIDDVPNPYRGMVVAYSQGGPVQSINPRTDFAAPGAYYNGFLYTDTQLGATPETDALSPEWSGYPGWGADYKLSGTAAILWSLKFDKKGKVFASGLPVLGAYGQWVKVYDPRKDDTQPGGVGPHRLGVETTYDYSDNPALHAGTYAYGRYLNGKRVLGMGLPADGINWAVLAAWANVCDANGWTMFGVVTEPGDKWGNLIDICLAGGAEPVAGARLSFKYSAPTVALDTITADDLTDDSRSVMAMQSFRDRINTAVPKYRSELHNWEIVDAEPAVISTFLAEDGEEKRETWPFNFVKSADQATQLATYRIWDSREIAPITVTCKPRLRHYRPGECLHVDLPEMGLDTDAIILSRTIDPATMKVTLELIGETQAKHAFCLGQTGVAPPTPALGQTAEERDEVANAGSRPLGYISQLIATSYVTDADPADGLLQATDTQMTVEDHTRTYSDKSVTVTGGTFTTDDQGNALTEDTRYSVYYDDEARAGGAVTLNLTTDPYSAVTSSTHPYRHYVGSLRTDVSGGSGSSGGGSTPPGTDPGDFR